MQLIYNTKSCIHFLVFSLKIYVIIYANYSFDLA